MIAIHGGAGNLPRNGLSKEQETAYLKALEQGLDVGYKILEKGGSALDAVEESTSYLEDIPLFNAGKGSALNHYGEVEMDASIACGKNLSTGAVSVLKGIRNPIKVARSLLEECECVYLSGPGAREYALSKGFEDKPEDYFIISERTTQLTDFLKQDPEEHGTAGTVALDKYGNLAAGTSTGGLVNKRRGRVGDSAIIGAGTYASNESCAVSCSGTGEYIIRNVTAHEISAMIRYNGMKLEDACEQMLHEKLNPLNGQFGIMALNINGTVKFVFNTPRMFRAWRNSAGRKEVLIYRE